LGVLGEEGLERSLLKGGGRGFQHKSPPDEVLLEARKKETSQEKHSWEDAKQRHI